MPMITPVRTNDATEMMLVGLLHFGVTTGRSSVSAVNVSDMGSTDFSLGCCLIR